MPVSMTLPASVAYGQYVYVIGGLYDVYTENNTWDYRRFLNTTLRYDTKLGQWDEMAAMNTSRGGNAALLRPSRDGGRRGPEIVVCGGQYTMEPNKTHLDSCERYDIERNEWAHFPSMLEGRVVFGLVQSQGRLFAIGGGSGRDESGRLRYMDTVERFDDDSNQWRLLDTRLPRTRYFFSTLVHPAST